MVAVSEVTAVLAAEQLNTAKEPNRETEAQSPAAIPPPGDGNIRIESARNGNGFDRPTGRRFGTLVHTVLRDVDLSAQREDVHALAELHGQVLGATNEEIHSAALTVSTTLDSPLIKAAATGRAMREVPFVLDLDESQLIEGVIDLLYEADGRWTLVDFKTDVDFDRFRSEYELQLRWYVEAAQRILGASIEGVLLRI